MTFYPVIRGFLRFRDSENFLYLKFSNVDFTIFIQKLIMLDHLFNFSFYSKPYVL
jgi:hypothetical protein